jgi:glyoxylase-like metal-dependent hydrolase (beta-lactamase superfamily II)
MADVDATQLAPGIHRVETVADDKLHGYHVLDAATGPVLVDSGFADAPSTVYAPFLETRGQSLADVNLVIVTHGDADHFGGNHALRAATPSVTIACHEADRRWVESVDRIVDERYRGFTGPTGIAGDHGIAYDDEVYAWLRDLMGPDEPVDLGLRGGETIPVGDRTVTLLHAPGHTRGHCVLWDGTHDVLLGGDACFGDGLVDVCGEPLQPPPYHRLPDYERTIGLLAALDPEVCSFTHYEPLYGDAVGDFVATSREFVDEFEAITRDIVGTQGPVTLREAINRAEGRLGDVGLTADLAYPLVAHLDALVDRGETRTVDRDGTPAWQAT